MVGLRELFCDQAWGVELGVFLCRVTASVLIYDWKALVRSRGGLGLS
jgi:hypothetical protein